VYTPSVTCFNFMTLTYVVALRLSLKATCMSRVVSGTEQKNSTSPFLPWMTKKATKGLTAFIPDMNCGFV
jgi:hypothetical protein